MTCAVAAALVVHAGLLLWLARSTSHAPRPVTTAPQNEASRAGTTEASWSVALLDVPVEVRPGPLLPAMAGSHEQSTNMDVHPNPRAQQDLPGKERASRGGGEPGGHDSWTGRTDQEDFRTQAWNDPGQHRLPRQDHDQARTPASPESLARQPEHGFGERMEIRARARAGEDKAAPGGTTAATPGGQAAPTQPQEAWEDRDPLFDGPPGALASRWRAGATSPRDEALVDRGQRATEAARRGHTSDDHAVAAASPEKDPAPIEMSTPGAGGSAHGVRGSHAAGGLTSQDGRPRGTAASTHDAKQGQGALAVRARRHNPYFRRMYQQLDELVEFPRELALSLRQGQVVARFTLMASGQVSELGLVKSSGFAAFDHEILSALEQAATFGPVPEELLEGRSAITVVVPYEFANPLIR